MEEGIIVGSESKQKNKDDFNLRTVHLDEDGSVKNIPESNSNDLVAFVLFATNIDDSRRIGLCYENQTPIKKSIIKAFTFEVPHDFDGDIRTITKEEVLKQAGFNVSFEEIEYLGKSYIGSKSGEFCHQFGIAVDKTRQILKSTADPKTHSLSHFWAMNEEVKTMEDWMCQLICMKRYTSKYNSIIVRNTNSDKK